MNFLAAGHRSRRLFACLALATTLLTAGGCAPDELADGTPIYRPGSSKYSQKVGQFDVTPEQAYEKARAAADRRNIHVLASRPLLIVGDEYLFGQPAERGVWLSGFYVDGQSGEVAWRKPDKMIYAGPVAGPIEAGEPVDLGE